MFMASLRVPLLSGVASLTLLAIYALILPAEGSEKRLEVTFLDVGQGDATFIESPDGRQVLIDGGKGKVVLSELGRVMGFFDRNIDLVVATHPDLDHIGGLVDVLERYEVRSVLMTENESDTPAAAAFLQRVREENAEIMFARRGQVYEVGSGPSGTTTLTILFPDRDPSRLESNVASIVAELRYGESEYLFMADSPKEIESYLVAIDKGSLQSDVLKVGHHGSRTSTSPDFIRHVDPVYGIISAGRDNAYGHPHKEVIDVLEENHVRQKDTAAEGSIFSYSDGVTVWFK